MKESEVRPPHLEQPYLERSSPRINDPLLILRREHGYAGIGAIGVRTSGSVEAILTGDSSRPTFDQIVSTGASDLRILTHPAVEGALSAPTKIFFDPSKRCPLKCGFCLAGVSTMKEQRLQVPSLNARQTDHVAAQIIETGALQVKVGGGEPFVFPHFPRLVTSLASAGVAVSTSTSGFNLTTVPNEYLAVLRDGRVKVSVSIDGEPDYHDVVRGMPGLSQLSLAGVERLLRSGAPSSKIELRSTLINTPESISQLPYLNHLSKTLGLRVRVRLAKPTGSAKVNDVAVVYPDRNYWELMRQMRELQGENPYLDFDEMVNFDRHSAMQAALDCGAGTRSAFVNAQGNFLPCGFILDHVEHKGHNLFQEERSMLELWQEGEAFTEVRGFLRRENESSACRTCGYVHSCQGGCPSVRLSAGLDIDPRCPTERLVYAPVHIIRQNDGIVESQTVQTVLTTGSITRYLPNLEDSAGQGESVVLVGEINTDGQLIVGTPGGKMDGQKDADLLEAHKRELSEEVRLDHAKVETGSNLPHVVFPPGVISADFHEATDKHIPEDQQPYALILTEAPKGSSCSLIAVYLTQTIERPVPTNEAPLVVLIPPGKLDRLGDVHSLADLQGIADVQILGGPLVDNNIGVIFVGAAIAIAQRKLSMPPKKQA